MNEAHVITAMVAVVAGFAALGLTDSERRRTAHPHLRRAAIAFWWCILIGGWLAFGWLAIQPGGLDAVWAWTRAQSFAMQAAMWLLLTPWMVGLAIWQTGLGPGLRTFAIVALAIGWSSLAFTLKGPVRSAR